jgi:hypothetical protein
VPELQNEPLCTMEIKLGRSDAVGAGPLGVRTIANLDGGTVKGAKLNGKFLQSGADWALFRPDGVVNIDVRAVIQTDDDAIIYVRYEGFIKADEATLGRLANGEAVDPSEYYMRTAPFFETGAEQYAWLNTVVTVGVGSLDLANSIVRYDVFAIT